jgi:putative oxidoreductase
MNLLRRLLSAEGPPSLILIRWMVGAVFLSEGIQKFLFPDQRGAGRFEKIGLPDPEFLGTFVGSFEVACGALVLVGLLTRLAVLPLITIMLVALASTKWPILQEEGFWKAAHDARTDWSMLLGSVFLLIAGPGRWSVDRVLRRRPEP